MNGVPGHDADDGARESPCRNRQRQPTASASINGHEASPASNRGRISRQAATS
jgi:hypothetical protein